MAKNGGQEGGGPATEASRNKVQEPKAGRWTERDPSKGRFAVTKRSGGRFRGVTRER